eukprot:5671096-Alexandrium_andersonii.AAC.1
MASLCFSIVCFLGCPAGAGGFFVARRAFRERGGVEREAAAFAPSAPPTPPPSPREAPRPAQGSTSRDGGEAEPRARD